jgi:hypothetical protein
MTEAANHLLAAFESLSLSDQQALAAEILRRVPLAGDLPEAALHQAAEELFLDYDAEEAARAQR